MALRLLGAQIRDYRSIIDSGWIDFEQGKTILVGPNEAGKTAVLKALQALNPPEDAPGLDPLRDYPRSKYDQITRGSVQPATVKWSRRGSLWMTTFGMHSRPSTPPTPRTKTFG